MALRFSSRFLRAPPAGSDDGPSRPSPSGGAPEGQVRPEAPPPARPASQERPTGEQEPPRPVAVPPVVVPRWVQLVLLPLALLGLWALARAAGPVLLILIAASVVALILNPLVSMIHRLGVPRGLAILLIYVGLLAVAAGVGVLLSDPVSNEVTRLANDVPALVRHANRDLANLQKFLNRHGIKVQIQQQGQTALQTLERNVLKGSGNIVSFSRDALGKIVTLSFDFVLVLVLSVYLLVYGREIGNLVRRLMPPGAGTPEDDFPRLVQRAVFGYVRGQLLFSLIMGASAAACLWIIGTIGIFPAGANYAVFFGAFYGLMELVPYIGPILGALPPVLVALFNDPVSAIWVTLMFVALQQLEGHFVAPQVFRISLRINPILIILALLIGYQLYGIAGALIALPVAAVLRETILYLRGHLVLEPWATAGPGARLDEPAAEGASSVPGERLGDSDSVPGGHGDLTDTEPEPGNGAPTAATSEAAEPAESSAAYRLSRRADPRR